MNLNLPFGTPKPIKKTRTLPSGSTWYGFDIRPPGTDTPMLKFWSKDQIDALNPGVALDDADSKESLTQQLRKYFNEPGKQSNTLIAPTVINFEIFFDLLGETPMHVEPFESLYSVEAAYGVAVGDDWMWLDEKWNQATSLSNGEGTRLAPALLDKIVQVLTDELSSPDGAQPIDLDDYIESISANTPNYYKWLTEYGSVDAVYTYHDGILTSITFTMAIAHKYFMDSNVYLWTLEDGFSPDPVCADVTSALSWLSEHPDHFVPGQDVAFAVQNFEYAIANIIIERLEARIHELTQREQTQVISQSTDIVIYNGQPGVIETRFIPASEAAS